MASVANPVCLVTGSLFQQHVRRGHPAGGSGGGWTEHHLRGRSVGQTGHLLVVQEVRAEEVLALGWTLLCRRQLPLHLPPLHRLL